MNADDFENQLASQAIRPAPTDWRDSILRTATQSQPHAAQQPVRVARRLQELWAGWFWPSPVAWAGLAGVWLVAFSLDWIAGRPADPGASRADSAPATWAQWAQHREMIAELTETEWPKPAAGLPPRIFVPRPRSENTRLHLRHA